MGNIAENIRNEFYERFLYPIYQLKFGTKFGYEVIKTLRLFQKTQWLSQDELLAIQTKKFQKLIAHVYHYVPYYGEVMKKKNLRPEDIKNINDIKFLPVITKKQIRENPKLFISKDVDKRRVIKAFTGGSTGEPLRYFRDWDTLISTEAAYLRGTSWAQYRIGDNYIDFMSPGWPSKLGIIRGRMLNKYYFPAFAKDNELMSYVQKIIKISPFCVTGYPSNLYRIANIFNSNGLNDIRFEVIFSTGEMLYNYQREFLEKIFRGNVFDYYGCNEVGSIAFECEYHRKHISEERLFVETTDSKGQVTNSLGELTITDFDNYAMPFIRYKSSDVGVITNTVCECKRGLKTISRLEGRAQDFLKTLDGNHVPAIFFPTRFRNLRGIDQYQIIQSDINNITIKIVKNINFSLKEIDEIKKEIKKMIGNTININIEECNYIPLTKRGKMRTVISHLPTKF